MIKKLLLFGVFPILAVIIVLYLVLGRIIKLGIETLGPEIVQTEVHLKRAVISPFSGKGQIEGLFVGSPKGFELDDKIVYLDKIAVELDIKSVLSDQVRIHHIHIHRPEIVYEQKLSGSNLGQLLKNIEDSRGSADTRETVNRNPQSQGPSKRIEITKLVIDKGSIKVGLYRHGMTVPLPRIELNDIGKDQGGIPPQEVAHKVVQALFEAVGNAVSSAATSSLYKSSRVLKKALEAAKEITQAPLDTK